MNRKLFIWIAFIVASAMIGVMFVLSSENISTSKERIQDERAKSAQKDTVIKALEKDADSIKIMVRAIENQNEEILHYQREQATQDTLTRNELEKIREEVKKVRMKKK